MGELGAFLRLERVGFDKRDPGRARAATTGSTSPCRTTARCATRAHAAWTAASRSATRAARSGNLIPDWNDLVYRDHWRDALTKLHATNNFPEFTGLICPAPCESACVLDINDDAVTIEQIELAIVTRGFEEGWIAPDPPDAPHRSHRRRDRLRARRAGGGGRAEQARAQRHGLRARRGPRRAAALRRAGRQAREVDHRPAREPARGGGDRVPLRRGRGPRRERGPAAPGPRRRGRSDRVARASRPRGSRPRARRRALRNGVPLPAQPRRGGRRGTALPPDATGPRDQRRGQARGGGRRRRHRDGLHLERPARGRRGRAAARRLPAAAGERPPAGHALAAAAQAHHHHVRARRGGRAPLRNAGNSAARSGRACDRRDGPARGGAAPRATCTPSRAASSRSVPTWS